MRRTVPLGAIVATIAVLLAGCGSDAPGETTAELSVTGTDRLAFEPAQLAITAGEEVTLELTAGEAAGHDFVVEGAADVGVTGDEGHRRFRCLPRCSCCLRHPYRVKPCGLYTFNTMITTSTIVPPTEWPSVLPSARSSSPDVLGSAATSAK
jgi:hypothetical protein